MTSRPTQVTSRSSTRGREYSSARARSVAAAYKLPVTLVRAALAEHIDTTRAWLTDPMIATIGARVTITWVLLQRRDRSIPSAADVHRQAGLFDLHPHPTPPADLAGNVPLNKLGALTAVWQHIITEETTAALTTHIWPSPTVNPERLTLDRTASTYLTRNNITL